MKAVIYHADAKFAWGHPVGNLYERLFQFFKKQCRKHRIKVVHLTLEGHPGWGDENHFYSGLDPKNVVLNREECFTQFLKSAPEDVYWFTEPDIEILEMWPRLKRDCALIHRPDDDVKICPAWRLARPKALPVFERFRDALRSVKVRPGVGHDWHGNSEAFTNVWHEMGCPGYGRFEYLGVSLDFRRYEDYIKGQVKYTRNSFGKQKLGLVK